MIISMLALLAIAATASAQNKINGHEYVDLGLPSGTLWATCNVGAEKPEDYGLYFAWGETKGYTGDTSDGRLFNWDNYKWGKKDALTNYTDSDGKIELYAADDAATANWGEGWRMPTLEEIYELLENTTSEWMELNGVSGRLFTAENGNSIFLPASGYRSGGSLGNVGSLGYYWSSLLYGSNPARAFNLYFLSDEAGRSDGSRCFGLSVRPVISKEDVVQNGIAINETNFPDANFRSFVSGTTIDTDKDGYLSDEEIVAVTSMNVSGKSIENLKGIEYFTAITELDCSHNKLTTLTIPLSLPKLTRVFCGDNQLTSLDVRNADALTTLSCFKNRLTSLNVLNNPNLTTLFCYSNKLTELDLSKNTKLTLLYCYGNQIGVGPMQALVNSLPTVASGKGKFFVIDTKNSDELNKISSEQVFIANGKNWNVYDNNGGSAVLYPGYDGFGIAINETNFPDANFRSYVSGTAIDKDKDGYLSDAEISKVTEIDVRNKSIENLKGIEFFTAVTKLHCLNNQLTSLNLSANTKLIYLSCVNNQLKSLDLSGCTALQTLYCYNNQLTALEVKKNTALTTLSCYGNQIKGDKMQALVNSLPTVTSGDFVVVNLKNSDEQNDITKAQVAIAKGKNWTVYDNNGGSGVVYDGVIAIDATNFPDEKFRNWVLAQEYGKDGYLTDAEIAAVTEINIYGKSVKNLKGIEYFTALTK
ncbi:MAG: leucine-rich repeat domain-containing protein, partial [Prevotella sp.]|nr:leucine-rich repeat domain-containing protein [Prevotella sp.]